MYHPSINLSIQRYPSWPRLGGRCSGLCVVVVKPLTRGEQFIQLIERSNRGEMGEDYHARIRNTNLLQNLLLFVNALLLHNISDAEVSIRGVPAVSLSVSLEDRI